MLMIWNNIELFNVAEIEQIEGGEGIRAYRFPQEVRKSFVDPKNPYAAIVGEMTTGVEMRFIGEGADIVVSARQADGSVEIFRGDFLVRTVRLPEGERVKLELRSDTGVDKYNLNEYSGRYAKGLWRIVFDHDYACSIHEVSPIGDIRPPEACEIPKRKILCYGSSITHSAGAGFYTNSYVYTMGRMLGVDVLCKGMGGSCYIQREVADYIADTEWDILLLELGINMAQIGIPVSTFDARARYIVEKAVGLGKPVILISNYKSYLDLPGAKYGQLNEDYVCALERIYDDFKCENLYYIRGRDIITSYEYLLADVLHPSPYGHGQMGKSIAEKIKKEFKII